MDAVAPEDVQVWREMLADRIGRLSDWRLHDLKVYVSLDDVLTIVRDVA